MVGVDWLSYMSTSTSYFVTMSTQPFSEILRSTLELHSVITVTMVVGKDPPAPLVR